MDIYITGQTIKKLREEKTLTQTQLAEKIGVSSKAVSKWETGKGLPDISLIEPLSKALGVSVMELMSGDTVINKNLSSNLLLSKFYVCPVCGNVIHSTGATVISCCGITLPPLEAEEADEEHSISIEAVEDEKFITVIHDMTKQHFISFIKVVRAPSTIKISAPRTVLGVGEGMQLGYTLTKNTEAFVTYTSNNPAVMTVSESGYVTAVAPGLASITATTHNGKSASITLEVKAAPSAIFPAVAEVSVSEQDSWVLGYAVNEGAAGSASFACSDPAIASVDPDGRIHGLKQGTAEIIVTAYNGVSASVALTVVPAPTSISLSAAKATLGQKETLQLVPTLNPEGTMSTIKFTTNRKNVAKVDENGLVTAVQAGTAIITATTFNGLKATYTIKVVRAPSAIKIAAPRTVLGVGEGMQLGYTLTKNTQCW